MRISLAALAVASTVWLLAHPFPAQAHIGGGPPFLSVNGKDAPTNPLYIQSTQAFAIEQDTPPESYLVNQPIHFKIELDKLPVPLDVAKQSSFRWTWDDGSTEHELGAELDHTYTKVGSHVVTLEAKAPGDLDYTLYDTARLDVIPHIGYQLPHISIAVARGSYTATSSIQYVAKPEIAPEATVKSVIWDFGTDEGSSTEMDPVHAYKEQSYLHFVFVQLTDSNGFTTENGITLTANGGQLSITGVSSTATPSPVEMVDASALASAQSATNGTQSNFLPWIVGGAGLVVVLAIAGMVVWKQRSAARPPRRIR